MNSRKQLLLHQKVEVRQFEEGLRGSWHAGVVVGVSDFCRHVKYDELLSEAGDSKLVELIPVTKAVEGLCRRRCHVSSTYRGRIRPQPPPSAAPDANRVNFLYGLCVDAFYEDAWWEGVIFDQDVGAEVRSVFFPDEGDELKFNVRDLRVSRKWDEYLDTWRDTGGWLLMELAEELGGERTSPPYLKKVWFHLRSNAGFVNKISEWTHGNPNLWRKYVMEVLPQVAVDCKQNNPAVVLTRHKRKQLENCQQIGVAFQLHSAHFLRSNSNGFHAGDSIQTSEKTPNGCRRKKEQSGDLHLEPQETHQDLDRGHLFSNSSSGKALEDPATRKERNQFITKGRNSNTLQKAKDNMCMQALTIREGHGGDFPVCQKQNKERRYESRSNGSRIPVCITRKRKGKGSCKIQRKCHFLRGRSYPKERIQFIMKGRNSKTLQKAKDNMYTQALTFRKGNSGDFPVYEKQNRKRRYESRSRVPIRTTQKRKGKHPCSAKEKCHFLRGRSYPKKFQMADRNIQPQPSEEQKTFDALPKHGEVVKHCRGPLRFSGYDKSVRLKDMVSRPRKRRRRHYSSSQSDTRCSTCHHKGILILCNSCCLSYHTNCVGLEDTPFGDWVCPSCRCGVCGLRGSGTSDRRFIISCYQCTRQYHMDCVSGVLPTSGTPPKNFCSQNCFQIYAHLHQMIGKSNPTSIEGLSWMMLKRGTEDIHFVEAMPKINYRVKLSKARNVMQECFHPIIDPCSKRNIVVDVLSSRVSKFKRLNFHGFYTMVLQKGDEVTCVAAVRIHGPTVAEMPLVCTAFDYRQLGMCHVLVNELENVLNQLGVGRLVLPSVPERSQTWKDSFGFAEMSRDERSELLGFPLLVFQGTTLYQKLLTKQSMETKNSEGLVGISKNSGIVSGFRQGKDNQIGHCNYNFCRLYYKRGQRNKIIGKENMIGNCNRKKNAYKYVYKRRRILAHKVIYTNRENRLLYALGEGGLLSIKTAFDHLDHPGGKKHWICRILQA